MTEMNNSPSFLVMLLYLSVLLKVPAFCLFVLSFLLLCGIILGQFSVVHSDVWKVDELSPPMRLARTAVDMLVR